MCYFEVEKYIKMNLSSSERSVLAEIRLGILPLHIETGKFNNTKLEDRHCNICNQGKIDDCYFFYLNVLCMHRSVILG